MLDVVLIAMLLGAALRGWRQGALSQVLAFGGAALGLVLGAALAPTVASQIVDRPGLSLALWTLGLLIVGVLLGQGIGFALGWRLRAAAHRTGVGALDSAGGIAVGLGTTVVSFWLIGAVLAQAPLPALARQVRGSAVFAAIDETLPPPPDIFGRVATYLDQRGFPQVFAGIGGTTAPPVAPPADAVVAAAAAAGQPGTVQVEAIGCGGVSTGSGWVVQPGFVVTNAHVVAGGELVSIRDAGGTHDAVPIHVDASLDLAVISAPTSTATPLQWAPSPAERGTAGATLGFPSGQRALNVRPAAVRGRGEALGRDIYGGAVTSREILTLDAGVQPGDSGGPFLTGDGVVAGVVFAASTSEPGVGYALTAERVRPDVDAAVARNTQASTGACRF